VIVIEFREEICLTARGVLYSGPDEPVPWVDVTHPTTSASASFKFPPRFNGWRVLAVEALPNGEDGDKLVVTLEEYACR